MQTIVTAVHGMIVYEPYSGEREVFQEGGHRDEEQKRISLSFGQIWITGTLLQQQLRQ